jgi:hypothetical protein
MGFFFFKACGVTFAKYLLYIDVIIVKFSHETDINHKQINLLHLNTIYLLQECQGEEYEEKQHLFTCVYCYLPHRCFTHFFIVLEICQMGLNNGKLTFTYLENMKFLSQNFFYQARDKSHKITKKCIGI